MERITFKFDFWNHNELKDYLLSLNGVKNASIDDEDPDSITIDIDYDSKKMSPKVLFYEILAFMEEHPLSLLGFDKHFKDQKEYKLVIKDLCCDYCFKGMIEDLFDMKEITKAMSDMNVFLEHENVIVNLGYNSDLISLEEIKKIEKSFNE